MFSTISTYMKNIIKVIIFTILFSLLFFLVRHPSSWWYQDTTALLADIGGLTYLYSTVATIFALLAAFVILTESERWNKLNDAIRGELTELYELYLWSKHFSEKNKIAIQKNIIMYLEGTIEAGLLPETQDNPKMITVMKEIHNNVYETTKEAPTLTENTFAIFTDLLKKREERLEYSAMHLPPILKRTFVFSNILTIILSMMIGVRDFWLNYVFMLSIAVLGYIIYLLVDDLDNPVQPGNWQLTTNQYKTLLEKIQAEKQE